MVMNNPTAVDHYGKKMRADIEGLQATRNLH
jgi:hypothetical protein